MSIKEILTSIGALCAIVTLAVFIFTASSTLFTIMAGVGCLAVMFIYDEYKKLLWEKSYRSKQTYSPPKKDLDKKE